MIENFSFKSQERFWKNVNICGIDECWNWLGCKDRDGYGEIRIGRKFRAHRYVYTLYHMDIFLKPTDFICHKCDNPSCVNPNHLFLGNVQINTADMVSKDRQAKGEYCGNCKFSNAHLEALILEILNGQYQSYNQISKKYDLSVTHISRIFDGKFRLNDMNKLCEKYNTNLDQLKSMCKGIKF